MEQTRLTILKVRATKRGLFDFSVLKYRANRPEERIRMGLVRALERVYGYEARLLSTEYWLPGRRYRADVVVWRDHFHRDPYAIFETKRDTEELTDDHLDKLFAYAHSFRNPPVLIVLTNGRQHCIVRLRDKQRLSRFPTRAEATRPGTVAKLAALPPPEPLRRPPVSMFELSDTAFKRYLRAAPDLDAVFLPDPIPAKKAFLELYYFLLDDSADLRGPAQQGYRILEDFGVRRSSFGNSSGGGFNGLYRHVLLKTPSGQRNFCLSVSPYFSGFPNYPGCLCLIGGIDGKQALQLQSIIAGSRFDGSTVRLVHRGYIALGEGGRVSRNRVLRHLREVAPLFLVGEEVVACEFPRQRLSEEQGRDLVMRLGFLADVLDSLRSLIRDERSG